jgi:hypothetical protein
VSSGAERNGMKNGPFQEDTTQITFFNKTSLWPTLMNQLNQTPKHAKVLALSYIQKPYYGEMLKGDNQKCKCIIIKFNHKFRIPLNQVFLSEAH